MSNAKEIRTKVNSIKNTQKITRAMQMVAASKMRRAQDRMQASRPYAEKVKVVISHLAQGRLEYKHPYLIERKPKRVGFMVVSTDRGLCGGLNANLLKATVQGMRVWHEKEIPIDICSIGKKAESFFRRMGGNIRLHLLGLQ
jgi:F-type H+-transporting ATPase subunit gamma